MDETDKLIITADHGNDPTMESTDHSREYVPLLYYSPGLEGKKLGTRDSFSDIAKTIATIAAVASIADDKNVFCCSKSLI